MHKKSKGLLPYLLIYALVVGILVALDLLLKTWAVENLMGQPSRTLIPGILGLTYHENPGVAFGFLGGLAQGQWILSAVKIVILAGLSWYYTRIPYGRREDRKLWWVRVPIMLIASGGAGNLIDRITLGHVRDMLMFEFINFPIFNLADVFVVAGCFLGMFVVLFIVKELP